MKDAFLRRAATPADRAFIVHSWSTSFEGSPSVRGCDRDHYRIEMRRAINRLLDKASVVVCCAKDDPDTIVGWAAHHNGEFHYGYVKEAFRADCTLREILDGVSITAYTFRGRVLEEALIGFPGCEFRKDDNEEKRRTWHPPTGWRYTPRFTI